VESLLALYWKPVYKYLRVKWRAAGEDAEDLTQAFFATALEKGWLDRYDPARARFRSYLRTCLDGFVANERKAAGRLKRGGNVALLPLDFADAEGELRRIEVPDPSADLDAFFRREWVRHVFALALDALRRHGQESGKQVQVALFERYDVQGAEGQRPPSYADLAAEFRLPVTQVTNYLAWARREFRSAVLERLREATGSEAEYRAEARDVLGAEPP
jgi:DNA-directed RNA polymerase specialized sigma24 family protein